MILIWGQLDGCMSCIDICIIRLLICDIFVCEFMIWMGYVVDVISLQRSGRCSDFTVLDMTTFDAIQGVGQLFWGSSIRRDTGFQLSFLGWRGY